MIFFVFVFAGTRPRQAVNRAAIIAHSFYCGALAFYSFRITIRNMDTLQEKKILVTGATGFIGGRLAYRLATEEGATVTGTGRNLDDSPLLEKAGVTLAYAELLDFPRMRALAAGQDVIFHVAAWLGPRHGGREMAWPLNVFATLNLVRAAAEAGVARFVHTSSIAAYGPPAPGTARLTEATPVDPGQSAIYGRTKAEGEQKALALAQELGLELVVIRPGMVYGPGSYSWSKRMVQLLQNHVPVIFGAGNGLAYQVYIDNLVDGMILAAKTPAAAGEDFHFVDPQVTWHQWFGAYGEMCSCPPHRLPLWLSRLVLIVAERLPLGLSIDRDLLRFYTAGTRYSTEKAERLLGYRPQVGFAEGMARAEAWLRAEGYI